MLSKGSEPTHTDIPEIADARSRMDVVYFDYPV